MIIYSGIKQDFLDDVTNDVIAEKIYNAVLEKMHRHTGQSELTSWYNSMQYMFKVLVDNNIPSNAGVAIEYNLPQTAKRVDFIISGYDASGTSHAYIIELKQWSELKAIPAQDGVVTANVETYTGHALRTVSHPSYQAWSYAQVLYDFNEEVQNGAICLHPCTYLHNYHRNGNSDPLYATQYSEYLSKAPAFVMGDVPKLREFISHDIKAGDNKQIIEDIDHGKLRPSKSLQDSLAKMLDGNKEFCLLDDQKVVYEMALVLARESKRDNKKRVYIVKGGPGTGKSVVAINLLCQLTQEEQIIQYVSKNSAPRNVYETKLKGKYTNTYIKSLFKGSGTYYDMEANTIDTLVVDEAHRLNEKSGMFQNKGENQIKEIINAARCSIFFIDEHQKVTTSDVGSIREIKHFAKLAGADVYEDELLSQFRCNGSDGYLAWIDNTLEISETANFSLEGVDFDFQVMDTPQEMENLIRSHNQNNKARILAGYCWDWPKEERNNSSYCDIKINDYGISWNLGSTSTFAIDTNSINEAGCIHTTQGLEFDYVGVIIGDDMRYENDHIITDVTKRAKTDQSIKGLKSLMKNNPELATQEADEIIKNTYRILMTRGMKGCYVYCTNEALRDHLRESIGEYKYAMVSI